MAAQLKLGKTAARKGAVTFKLKDYVDLSAFPTVPLNFGHEDLIGADWGMLGNDRYGDCVWAGAAHETMYWNKEAGRAVTFNDAAVLRDYTAVTGFNPNDLNTDQGTDMQVAASYRRKTGIQDAAGNRHKIAAYLAITPGDYAEHMIAAYLFGAVGIGLQFPSYALDQFRAGKIWTYRSKHSIEGGHYIPVIGRRSRHGVAVSWGRPQPFTLGFFNHYNDESAAYVSDEFLTGGLSPDNRFNLSQLIADLSKLK